MTEVEELEARISNLSPQDLAKLRDWFLELDNQVWDEQIAADYKAGKLQRLVDKAREELGAGKAREL
jgi:hypothetical protein